MKPDRPSTTLTMLQAIELFRGKPPAQWSADELAAFRDRLAQSPVLVSSLGGQHEIDRRLTAVAEALQNPQPVLTLQPADADVPVTSGPSSKVLWRAAEVSIVVLLLLSAGVAALYLWPRTPKPTESTAREKAAGENANAAAKSPPKQTPEPEDIADDEDPAPVVVDENHWQGWSISAKPETQRNLADDWDLADPSNPRPTKVLIVEDGPLALTRRGVISPDAALLEIDVRLLALAARPGRIAVRVADTVVAEATIGAGETKWPWHVPLAKWAGKDVPLQVDWLPSEPKQKLAWWHVALVAAPTREPRAESALAQDLASTNMRVRLLAARNAAKVADPAALPALIEAMHDRAIPVRQAAVAALLKYRDPRARQALRAALKDDADPALRTMIATSLARNPSPEDVALLIAALQDKHVPLRQAALRTLADINDPAVTKHLIDSLSSKDTVMRDAAAAALVRRNEPAVHTAFLAALQDKDSALKGPAAQHFSMFPRPDAVPGLIDMLKDKGAPRRQAARALGRIANDPAIDALSMLLKDADPPVRKAAIEALRQSPNPKAAAALKAAGIPKK